MNGVQTRLKCKPNVKRCKRFVFAAHSPLLHPNTLKTKAIIHFQTDHILTRFVFPPLKIRKFAARVNEKDTSLSGEVEIDETFVGGKNKNRHKDKKVEKCQGRSFKDKVPVFGILERGGKLIAKVVPNTQAKTLVPIIKEYVKEESVVYTDGWEYTGLHGHYEQRSVDHEKHFYGTTYATDEGEIITISTNGIENAWSHFDRVMLGTYIRVSKKHLQKYIDEFVFRFNTRNFSDSQRFNLLLRNIA